MAKDFKGKYPGPDEFRGNKKKIAAWKAAKKAKNASAKKKSESSGTSALEKQAAEIAKNQYAGALSQLSDSKEFNQKSYDTQTARRQEALTGELGSQDTAWQITRNTVSGLKGEALAQYVKDKETQDAISKARDEANQARNSNTLTSYQQAMIARGLEPSQAAGMTANLEKSMGYTSELDRIRNEASASNKTNTSETYDRALIRTDQQQTSAAANARAAAQNDLMSAYDQYVSRQQELDSSLTKTKLDKGATEADVLMTLKKEKELAKREKAQLELEQYVAGLKNSQEMAKIAQSDYWKEAELALKKSDLNLKGKELDAKIQDMKRKGNLEEQKLLEKIRDNLRKNATADAKAGIKSSTGYRQTTPPKKYGVDSPSRPNQ